MEADGPQLDQLTRRLAETPAIFLDEPVIRRRGEVDVGAVMADLLVDLGGERPSVTEAGRFRPTSKAFRNSGRLTLISAWLLHDPWFVGREGVAERVGEMLPEGVTSLAEIIDAERFVTDAERREELVRLLLDLLQLRPAGESANQAADRLKSLDSVERERIIRASQKRAEEEKARKLREQMKKRKAREAAAKANREW